MFRHELKYLCNEQQIAVLKSRLQGLMKIDSHTVDGQYSIRSLYFDSYANTCYYENENGTNPREKFRLRIYNSDSSRISLECKRKEKEKTYKTTCLITKNQYNEIIQGGSLEDIDQKPNLLRKFTLLLKTQLYHPTVIVEYDRIPFIYEIGNVRVTFDLNIRSASAYNDFFSSDLHTRPILPRGQHLIEIKYDELIPDFIKKTLQTEDLFRNSFSKYYLCRKYSLGGIL